jgi:hypothetical protein
MLMFMAHGFALAVLPLLCLVQMHNSMVLGRVFEVFFAPVCLVHFGSPYLERV